MTTLGVTEREREVLSLVVQHLTNAQIAERLVLSVRTVESHVSSLIRKLDVDDRRALARRTDELDLLRPAPARRWPSPANQFVGRDAEVAELLRRLREHRMVTVTGPGGVGKTRLTTHAVQQIAPGRPDGAWFVDLSQVAEPASVVLAVAAAVGVAERPGQSLHVAATERLRGADGVLLVDNCEHLLPAVEALVTRLVGQCPRLTVVATSRAPLRSPDEEVFELPGLSEDDAVRLFRTRAESAGGTVPDDPRATRLCARLEGMALAIELAAARYPRLGLDGLEVALSDPLALLGSTEGTRQRSLRATIGWSVDLLDSQARAAFARLSVFAAPWTVAAARAVAVPDGTLADAACVLVTLADQHLLNAEPGNPTTYSFQEVVRQYAAELLGDGAADVLRRHAQWAAAELASLDHDPRDDDWCARFDRLAVEVRAVLAGPVQDRELGERFAEELVHRGRLEEAQHRFEALATTAAADARDRVQLLRQAAGAAAARLVGDDAMRLLDQAAEAATAAGDLDAVADALAWSAIYGAFHPGIMAHPPTDAELARRLAAAVAAAPAGSAAEAAVAVARSAALPDESAAEAAARAAARQAVAAGLPLVASAALDAVCSGELARGDYAAALESVTARGAVMNPLPLAAATAYAFNDYLLMGCEVSLAAGDLSGSRAYAERLEDLPCYRDYVHPALARRLQVDLLAGDFAGAVERGVRFLLSWERAGRHRAGTLAVGAYALATVHGLLGNDEQLAVWTLVTEQLLDGPVVPTNAPPVGWGPTLQAWLLLEHSQADSALRVLRVEVDDAAWRRSTTAGMWRPWYAAASAEAAALAGSPDEATGRLRSAAAAARGNPVAAVLVRRAQALARGDRAAVAASAPLLAELGAAYQSTRSLELSRL